MHIKEATSRLEEPKRASRRCDIMTQLRHGPAHPRFPFTYTYFIRYWPIWVEYGAKKVQKIQFLRKYDVITSWRRYVMNSFIVKRGVRAKHSQEDTSTNSIQSGIGPEENSIMWHRGQLCKYSSCKIRKSGKNLVHPKAKKRPAWRSSRCFF